MLLRNLDRITYSILIYEIIGILLSYSLIGFQEFNVAVG